MFSSNIVLLRVGFWDEDDFQCKHAIINFKHNQLFIETYDVEYGKVPDLMEYSIIARILMKLRVVMGELVKRENER